MRRYLLVLFSVVTPAFAQEPVVDSCAIDVALACPVEVVFPELGMRDGDPVIAGPDRLTFVALDRDEPEQTFAVDVSLTDGRILRKLPLGVAREDIWSFDWLVDQAGQGYLLLVVENERERVLVFFDAAGVPRSRMPEVRPAGWPYELTMARALMLLARQNVLTFDGDVLHGQIGRFDLQVSAADGRMTVVEGAATSDGKDTLEDEILARLAPLIAESGAETVHTAGDLSVVTINDEFGMPTRLILRLAKGGEVLLDQPPEPDLKNRRTYHMARLSPDGRYLAVGRGAKKDGGLIVLSTTTGAALYRAPVGSCWSAGLRWLPDGRIALLCFEMRDGIHFLIVDPRLPR